MKLIGGDSDIADIKRYLEAGGPESDVELTEKQMDRFNRLQFADELIRRNFFLANNKESIAKQLMWRFEISRASAFRDIVNAEDVFSSSTPLNKKYIIQRRIEVLETNIQKLYEEGNQDIGVKLEKELRGYIDLYPDYVASSPAKKIIYNITNNNLMVTQGTAEEAFEEADVILKQMEEDDEL